MDSDKPGPGDDGVDAGADDTATWDDKLDQLDVGDTPAETTAATLADTPAVITEEPPISAPAGPDVPPARGWWIAPVAIIGVIILIGIIGVAVDNGGTTTAVTVATTVPPTVTSINLATATTAPLTTETTAATTSTASTVANITGVSTSTVTTASGVTNQAMSITATWSNQNPTVNEEVTFDVTVSDPDASPIGECGGSPPGGFGDSAYAPGCQVDCANAGTHQAGDAAFHYAHTYTAAGTYTVKFSYQSAGGCTSQNPYASQRTITFPITVS